MTGCISPLLQKWSGIDQSAKVIIVTDDVQMPIADSIKEEKIFDVQVVRFAKTEAFFSLLRSLDGHDLVIALFSINAYMHAGANEYFSAFRKPEWLQAKYLFVRLDISLNSLVQGLSTDKALVYAKIEEMNRLDASGFIHVTSESGTDISFQIKPFSTCSHEITADGGVAFLPPSETSADVVPDTANGRIVVDMTVGQLYHFGELLGYFGLVTEPVTLIIQDGVITDVTGDSMAAELKAKLFSLPLACRRMVELGQGLSNMAPTGLIGVDESIIDSCHFGFGDGWKCGTHLDVVIKRPSIRQIP